MGLPSCRKRPMRLGYTVRGGITINDPKRDLIVDLERRIVNVDAPRRPLLRSR